MYKIISKTKCIMWIFPNFPLHGTFFRRLLYTMVTTKSFWGDSSTLGFIEQKSQLPQEKRHSSIQWKCRTENIIDSSCKRWRDNVTGTQDLHNPHVKLNGSENMMIRMFSCTSRPVRQCWLIVRFLLNGLCEIFYCSMSHIVANFVSFLEVEAVGESSFSTLEGGYGARLEVDTVTWTWTKPLPDGTWTKPLPDVDGTWTKPFPDVDGTWTKPLPDQ